jgi:hypothetical protein
MNEYPHRDGPRPNADNQDCIDAIVAKGPTGAFAVVGVATAIVVALWFAFYLFAYLPRGAVQ